MGCRYDYLKTNVSTSRGYPPGQGLYTTDYLMTSGLAGLGATVFTNPIWVVKTRMLSSGQDKPGAYRGMIHGWREILRHEGFPGLYRGLAPSLFGVSHGAVQFAVYEVLKGWSSSSSSSSSSTSSASSSSSSSFLGASTRSINRQTNDGDVLISSPQSPLQSQHQHSSQQIHPQPPSIAREQQRREMKRSNEYKKPSNLSTILFSSLSKSIATCITYPYQVVRSRLQTYDAGSTYTSARDVVGQMIRKEGWKGFYKG